nr:putative ribonuclease h protein [Quercus suber]
MPLSIRLPPDKIIWGLTPSSIFTTKSAYKLLVSRNSTNHAGTSSSKNQRLFWRSLWQLRVLNKLKHFAWRACNDALPIMTYLVRRHIATTEVCSTCQA